MTPARFALGLLATVAIAACGNTDTSSSSQGSSSVGATTPTPTPSGPASAQITFGGDAPLTAPLTNVIVSCRMPTLQGLSITVNAQPQGQPGDGIHVFVTIRDGSILVTLATSAGNQQSYIRQFSGTGTTGFNAATGVQLSGALSDTNASGFNKGTLGAVTSITGSVSCGNQQPGTSDVRITGVVAEGSIDATMSPVRVNCANGASGVFVGVTGILTIAGHQAVATIIFGESSLQLNISVQGGATHLFTTKQGKVGDTVNSTGGTVDSDMTEPASAGSTATHTVHLKGSAVCGTTSTY